MVWPREVTIRGDRAVVYHTRISYRTRMVHTVRVYAYGTTVRVWYGYLYHMRIAVLYC